MTAVKLVAKEEGFRSKPYQDTLGVWTIGHGITNMTEEESLAVMAIRLDNLSDRLRDKYEWVHRLSETRQAVILSMNYQLGEYGFSKFKKMIAALISSDYTKAAEESLDSRYAKQTPNRANRQAQLLIDG